MFRSKLVDALLTLRQEQRSGVLAVRAEGIRTFIYLLRGEPVFAEEETIGETLGRLLVRQNKLTQKQYVVIIDRMTDALIDNEQLRFGEVAVELGFLTSEEVQQALADQVRWKIIRMLQRADHEFAFQESTGQVDAVVHLPLVLEALILEACRWVPDERKSATIDVLSPDVYPQLRLSVSHAARVYLTSPEERDFLGNVDGTRRLGELVALGEQSTADVPGLITALLWSNGLVLNAAPARPPKAAATPATPAQAFVPSAAKATEALRAVATATPPAAVHRGTVPTPMQFVPFKDAAKERADRAMALLRQQRIKPAEAARPPAAAAPQNAHEARLLAEQKFQRGRQQLFAGKHEIAQVELARARELQPDSIEYELYASWAAFAVGKANDSAALKRVALAAIKADPNAAFAYYVHGEMALVEKDDATARRSFQHAVKLDPNLHDAQRRLRLLGRK